MVTSVLSFGGGVNTVALAILLVSEGWRGHIVFADTGCEWPDTYCYMETFEREWLKPRRLEIVRLGAEWRIPSKQLSLIEYCELRSVVPLGMRRWCTMEYKVEPLKKWGRVHHLDNEQTMLGIAADESWRMPLAARPLVDRAIGRDGCKDIIRAAGFDPPHKSGCFICPFQRNYQWRELYNRYPDLFTRAERLEQNAKRTHTAKKMSSLLDIGGKTTLTQRRLAYESQMPLFDDAEYLDYRPCICQL